SAASFFFTPHESAQAPRGRSRYHSFHGVEDNAIQPRIRPRRFRLWIRARYLYSQHERAVDRRKDAKINRPRRDHAPLAAAKVEILPRGLAIHGKTHNRVIPTLCRVENPPPRLLIGRGHFGLRKISNLSRANPELPLLAPQVRIESALSFCFN